MCELANNSFFEKIYIYAQSFLIIDVHNGATEFSSIHGQILSLQSLTNSSPIFAEVFKVLPEAIAFLL